MPSANLFLDKARTNNQGQHPVCIRVCHMRKQWPVTIKFSCTAKDFEKMMNNKGTLSPQLSTLREQLFEQRKKAQDILDGLDVITKDTFKEAFFHEVDIVKISSLIDMQSQFTLYIEELKSGEQVRSAEMYTNALKSLLEYKPNRNLQEIDKKYLSGYELWMDKQGCSASTASMYLRCLRSIFNRCVKAKKLSNKYYPFEDFTVYAGKKSKNVLYPNQVEAFLNYTPKTEAGQRCKDYWFFSFLCNGMNPKDIMSLKWSYLKDDKLTYNREKVKRTKADVEEIVMFLHPMAMDIIKKHGNKKSREGYIFPLFNHCANEQQRYEELKNWKRQTNRILGRMAVHLGFNDLNMGLARHSFGTALAMKNVSINVISKMLGHSKIETTTHYIKSLPDETLREINMNILPVQTHLRAV